MVMKYLMQIGHILTLQGLHFQKNRAVLNAWTPENRNTNIPRINGDDNNDNMRISDFYVEDGSYFRLKNIQLGYTFSKTIDTKN